jgi:hypothetical protein
MAAGYPSAMGLSVGLACEMAGKYPCTGFRYDICKKYTSINNKVLAKQLQMHSVSVIVALLKAAQLQIQMLQGPSESHSPLNSNHDTQCRMY